MLYKQLTTAEFQKQISSFQCTLLLMLKNLTIMKLKTAKEPALKDVKYTDMIMRV